MHIFSPAVKAPAREVADYSNEERSRFRETFGSIAARYRRQGRKALWRIVGGAACILLGMLLPKFLFPWFGLLAFIFWCAVLVSAINAPSLICPGCSNDIEYNFGSYCPECGKTQLRPGSWSGERWCNACGKAIRRGKGRSFKMRVCTHCGLLLDERGL
jgi:hypothetical protein